MTTTVTYRYLVPDEGPTTATWTGNRTGALQAAILALDAGHDGDGWAYHPEELRDELAGEPLVVSFDAMVELGAGLCAGHELDALYDPWCANTAAVPVALTQQQLLMAFWAGLADHVEELSDEEILADAAAAGVTAEDVAATKRTIATMAKRAKDDGDLFVATEPVEPWPETKPVDDIPD